MIFRILIQGEPVLDDWLRRRALASEASGSSRTYVVCVQKRRVVGYHAFAVGAVAHVGASGRAKHNMPDPAPVMVLGSPIDPMTVMRSVAEARKMLGEKETK